MPMPAERRLAERPARSVRMFIASFAIWASAAHATDFCIREPRADAVDSSAPVTQSFLDRMKAIGISTIIRYYDHENKTRPATHLRGGDGPPLARSGSQ